MSGLTWSWEKANSVPVRPMPHWISSSTINASCASHSSRTFFRKPGSAGMTPPSPWMGSSITPATPPWAKASSSAAVSLKAT